MSGPSIIVAIISAVWGAILEGMSGFIFGGAIGFALGSYIHLSAEVSVIKRKLNELIEQAGSKQATPAKAELSRQASETLVEEVVIKNKPVASKQDIRQEKVEDDRTSQQTIQNGFDPVDFISKQVIKFFTEGNVVVRVGLVILFFGVAFLIKYAIGRNLFPIELRLAAVCLGAFVMLVIGWRLREKRQAYALLMQGGAVGLLYLTVFASAKLYDLIPLPVAFLLMVVFIVLSSILAVQQDSKSMMVFGMAGGYLAPILMSTGKGSHVILFSYYALLNAGVFGVAWRKAWRSLNTLAFVSTFIIGTIWGYQYYKPEYFSSTEPFLILYFLFFVAISILFAHRQPPQLKGYIDGLLVFGVPIFTTVLQRSLVEDFEYGMAISSGILAVFYFALSRWLWRKQIEGMRLLAESFLALGTVFITLVVPYAFDGYWTGVVWALEGAALLWVGIRQERCLARWFGLGLQLLAGVVFLLNLNQTSSQLAIINSDYLGCLTLAVAAFLSGLLINNNRESLLKAEGVLSGVLLIWAGSWWLGAGFNEINRFVGEDLENHTRLIFLSGSLLMVYALLKLTRWDELKTGLLAISPVIAVFTLRELFDLHRLMVTDSHPFEYFGYLVWPVSFVINYFLLRTQEVYLSKNNLVWQHLISLWSLILLVTLEVTWLIDTQLTIASVYTLISWALIPVIAIMLINDSKLNTLWPVTKYINDYKGAGLLPVVLLLILWSLYTGFSSNGDPSPLPFITIFNPLEIMMIATYLILFKWCLSVRNLDIKLLQEIDTEKRLLVLAAVGFICFNTFIARAVHAYMGVSFDASDMVKSIEFQSTISVVWTILALAITIFATRKLNRHLWFVGAALIGAVVVKLFIIDLSSTATVERIVSFLVVGILLLVVGYFSPLPPRSKEG